MRRILRIRWQFAAAIVLTVGLVSAGAIAGSRYRAEQTPRPTLQRVARAQAETGAMVALPAAASALGVGDVTTREGLDTLWALQAAGVSTITPSATGPASLTRTVTFPQPV